MTWTFSTRNVHPAEPGVAEVLDAVHALSVTNYRPAWACSNPPYPARAEFDEMVSDPAKTLLLCHHEGEMVGWWLHNDEGHVLAGAIRHSHEYDGAIDSMDRWAIEVIGAMAAQVRHNTGGHLYHLAVRNPRMHYALQVQCGLPASPTVPAEMRLDPPRPPGTHPEEA